MPKQPEPVLVVAPQALLRADIARLLLPLGCRIEIASDARAARELMRKEAFRGAIIAVGAPAAELPFLTEMHGAVGKLVILAADAKEARKLAASLPDALVSGPQPPDQQRLLAFFGDADAPRAGTEEIESAANVLHFAGCTLDVPGHVFLNAERQEVGLSPGEFGLLVAFARNAGRVLSRVQLRNAIDGGSADPYDRSIDMLIGRLRRKVEADPAKPQLIVTVPGVGYKFAAVVRRFVPAETAISRHDEPSTPSGEAAERRQLTVLSCRIVGLATLASKLDIEDLGKTAAPIYSACAAIFDRFGGTMLRSLGEHVIAYFGYPQARENDAESAVRAALALSRELQSIETPPIGRMGARIGIATGMMLIGSSESPLRQPAALGEALSLALHMERTAPADGVLIEARTRALIGRFFQCEEIKSIAFEHAAKRQRVWRVVEEVSGIPRFAALREAQMPPLVGRKAELAQLFKCWRGVRRGSGKVVLMVGEPGIGKSRLAAEFEDGLRSESHAKLQYSGYPHRVDAPMSALLDELQSAAGFASGESARLKRQKIRKLFGALGDDAAEGATLVCSLFGLPGTNDAAFAELSPRKRKERVFFTLLRRIEAMASRQAVFAVVEDVQWLDPTTLDFVALLVERAMAMRLLVLLIGRPEFVPPWPDCAHIITLPLSPLSRSDSVALVQHVSGEQRLPALSKADIVARAEGVPLFVEELTRSVLENSTIGETGTPTGGQNRDAAPIPTTLNGLLLARLDRLERGRTVAQAGAVIGREFSLELLRRVVGLDEALLTGAIDEVVASGLVFRRGTSAEAAFIFKHSLVRDAAYGTLSRQHRQALHAGVARAYEENFEAAEAQPELMAYHWKEGGEAAKAIKYLLIAAERALLRSATSEALSHLTQARELTGKLPASRERLQFELKLEITLARTLLARSGYTAPETREAYQRARQCCEELGDQTFLPLTMHGQWVCAWVAADYPFALDQARQLHAWGERNHEPVGVAVAHSDLGLTFTPLGQLEEARHHLEAALRINKFILPGREPFVASDADGRISTLSFLHHCLLLLGFPDQAEAAIEEATMLKPANMYSRALAQVRMLRAHAFARDVRATGAAGLDLLRLAEKQDYPFFVDTANIYLGWARALEGDPAGGIESAQKGMAQLRAINAKSWRPFYLTLMAECHEQARDFASATATVAEALAIVAATGERIWEAELLRLKGRQLLHVRDDDAAHQCLVEALHTARQQKAKLLELRAATSLAELLRRKRRIEQAREVLAPVYGAFTEGFGFIDLRDAKTLLDAFPHQSA